MDLIAARQAIADAVTAVGLPCAPYPPDNAQPKSAFVDTITADMTDSTTWFCSPVLATYTVIALAERNDIASSLAALEAFITPVSEAMSEIGVRTLAVTTAAYDVGGIGLPSVQWTLQATTN